MYLDKEKEKVADVIKIRLLDWLLARNKSAIYANEVLFSSKSRRSDLVKLYNKQIIAYEIKGELDNTSKLKNQIKDYLTCFDKIFIVTTPNLVNQVMKIVPETVGIIVFKNNFKVVRPASPNRKISKKGIVSFLRRGFLEKHLNRNKRRLSIESIHLYVLKKYTFKQLHDMAFNALHQRYGKLFELFMLDRNIKTIRDDLLNLTGEVTRLS